MEDYPDFHRASQDMKCDVCDKEYRSHPMSEHLAFDDKPYLHRLCDGTLVKL